MTTSLATSLSPSDAPTITTDGAATTTAGGATEVESFSDAVDAAVTEVQELAAGFAASLPRLLIALLVLVVFYVIARLVRRTLEPRLTDLKGESIARVLSSMVFGAVMVFGVLVFLAVAFPAVNVATLLGAGGVVALAAGFAFQDLLENLMAGILILIRQPFQEGDIIEVDETTGVVEAITIRETRIRRFDRQTVLIPNGDVYTNAIRIQTAAPLIRSSLLVGVGYDDDLQVAEDTAVEAMLSVEGVASDPGPEAFYTEFGDSSINLDLRYFHDPTQHELRRLQGEVVKAIKIAFDAKGIDIPFPIRTLDATAGVADAMRAIAGRGNGAGRVDVAGRDRSSRVPSDD